MTRVASADLGKSSAKLLVAELEANVPRIVSRRVVDHGGDPFTAVAAWYREAGVARADALGVTGLYASELTAPALSGLPEDACLEAALGLRRDLVGAVNLVSVGARGYAVLSRDARGRVQYLENDKCSSGTGETMQKTASRFGLSLAEADALACTENEGIAITARCSVFAKSEMTHFGNQGEPKPRLFRGYFASIARYVAALLERVRAPGPVYVIGGGSRLAALRACLASELGTPISVLDGALELEATGALALAAEHIRGSHARPLPDDPTALFAQKPRKLRTLAPASRSRARVVRLEAPRAEPRAARAPAVLGLDLGSTGSKAALVSLASGEIVHDVYDRTRGNPVEAAQRLIAALGELESVDVRAIGVTGSGREAVATLLRAAFPADGERIVVLNEIVAHATAAIRSDPDAGRSLSVVEIGGQDAKFIQIAGGHVVESDLNKACSAGTGSFLEEQAALYGVSSIEEFGRLAREAESPPDLGQMCTVFVAETAAEAQAQGFSTADVFAGFQYAVVHNYLNRVMGQRSFGERVFFQGKPASGESLAWTLAAVSGRDVVVPPNPGAMGAWGIGLCARDELGRASLEAAPRLDLARVLAAKLEARSEFRCDDKRCATLCRIERARVDVGGVKETVFSGGSCPKFELARASRPKLPPDAPSAFDEREALLASYRSESPGPSSVGVPEVGALAGFLPWVVTLLRELGLRPRVLRPSAGTLGRGEALCSAYDSCAPMKLAHGIDTRGVDSSFFPRLKEVTDRDGQPGRTCATEQAMPVVLARLYAARDAGVRVISPVVSLEHGLTAPGLLFGLKRAVEELGADPARLPSALHRAAEAQRAYEDSLSAIGWRTLAYGRARGIPVVAVCGSLHVIHERGVNAGVPTILRQNGVLALPMDCYRVPAHVDALGRVAWSDARRALRVALAAREAGDVYPLLLGAFGCGPASFVEQFFEHLMSGYPHTALESDGHGGAAGFVTRIQAFLHGVRQWGRKPSPTPKRRLEVLEPIERAPLSAHRDARLVVLSVGDGLSEVAAAAYRALGYDAIAAGPNSAESFALGKRDCSGKECLPYQLIWGAFRRELESRPRSEKNVLVQVGGQGACRNCLFSAKDRITLERMGLADRVGVRHIGSEDDVRTRYQSRFWLGSLVWDVLHQLWAHYLVHDPGGRVVGEMNARFQRELSTLIAERDPGGLRGLGAMRRTRLRALELVERAAREFAEFEPRASERVPSVLLTGDVYLRIDSFANDGIVTALAERGLSTLVEPLAVMVEYVSQANSDELIGLRRGPLGHGVNHAILSSLSRTVYRRARRYHPWLPAPDVARMLELARPIIDGEPFGEAPITVGSVLSAHHDGHADGVVLVSPWGCGPALVSESLLRPERDIPMLFVYSDGSPLDERRLNAFAHRVKRRPRRNGEVAA